MAPRLLAYVPCLLDERDCLLVVVPGGMAAETSAADRIGSAMPASTALLTAADRVGPSSDSGSKSASSAKAMAWSFRWSAS
jgi:hypothetical protein